jgi:tRNA(Ile)-lysidine synthase
VLLFLLKELRNSTQRLAMVAGYVDHGWRGAPPEELPLVHRNCLAAGTPLVVMPLPRQVPKTETAAREARYQLLANLAHDIGADAILTAHHADDQTETILFRLFRGTGLDGLTGIPQKRTLPVREGVGDVPVARPLLDVPRELLRSYANCHELRWFEDPTNQNLDHSRNLLRLQVMPLIRQAFPQAQTSLLRLSEVVSSDLDIIQDQVEPLLAQLLDPADPQKETLDAVRFGQMGVSYQRRILRQWLARLGYNLSFDAINRILDFLNHSIFSDIPRFTALPAGAGGKGRPMYLCLYKSQLRRVTFTPKSSAPGIPAPLPVGLEGQWRHQGLKCLFASSSLEELAIFPESYRWSDETRQQVWVDASAFANQPLTLRTRRPGDRFQPLGFTEAMRLKKFMMNRNIPRAERDRLPLLVAGDHDVLWVVGKEVSERLRVTERPTHHWELSSQ